MIIVTHEIGFAREISSRMVFMMDGAIVVDASPKTFFEGTPDSRLQTFLSKVL
jgi:ABC-type polar amino acid transport system ATPase subunit